MKIASTLEKYGLYVYLLPENKANTKNPDAIVNGKIYDFKQVNFKRIEHAFIEGVKQAGNVVIQLEDSGFNLARILGKLRPHSINKRGNLILIIGGKIFIFDFEDI